MRFVWYLIAIIWLVEIVNIVIGHALFRFGILPRSVEGLSGILLFTFIHGSVQHAVLNTIPLLVLGAISATVGTKRFLLITLFNIVIGGALVWVFARSSYHIGASLLIFAYFGFILSDAWQKKTVGSAALALVTLFLYGGMIYGILPQNSNVSWEGHLFGLLAGVLSAKFIK